jgi:hypothetical protein
VKAEQHGSIFVGATTRRLKELKSKVALFTHVHLRYVSYCQYYPLQKRKGTMTDTVKDCFPRVMSLDRDEFQEYHRVDTRLFFARGMMQ